MSDHDHPWGPPIRPRPTHTAVAAPGRHAAPGRPAASGCATMEPPATAPYASPIPPRTAAPPPPMRRSSWQRPWPWAARAACAALSCHAAAVVVNCAAEGVANIEAGGGFTVGALLMGVDAGVLLAVLVRYHRQAVAAGEAEQ